MNATQLHLKIKALRSEQAAVKGADREGQMRTIQGRIEEVDAQLAVALAAEDDARGSRSGAIVGGVRGGVAEQAFGPRAAFKGISSGFRAAITIPAHPGIVDPSIPAFADYPRGFVDTLIQAPTAGAVTFLRRGTRTPAAAQWATGAKAASSYEYLEATAPLTWIAHHTPISKTEASDWGQLQAIVEGEMMVGLAQAKGAAALVGDVSTGIVGVTNTEGVQLYTERALDNVYDTIRRQATLVYLQSGFLPTHVAMSPQVKEELDLLKGDDKHYLVIDAGTRAWGLEIVQDSGLTVVTTAGTAPVVTTTHNGTVVYAPVGATWYTKEADNVEIGLVNNQFIENAYTLLAEGRNALAVKYPDAFSYCQDAIAAVAV